MCVKLIIYTYTVGTSMIGILLNPSVEFRIVSFEGK